LQADVRALTAFPSRVPGTPGNLQAADYVLKRFKELLPAAENQVAAQEFTVTAPVTKRADITLGGQVLKLLPVYPNHVVPSSTPESGISAPVVYVGRGDVADFNGKKIDGAIVALDFNSGMNWITAADLGARAIIFLEQPTSNRGEAERKYAWLPIELPRYYAEGAIAASIRAAGQAAGGTQATINSQVTWERVKARNIVGFLPGKNPPQGSKPDEVKPNTIVIGGYYDSMSVVPDRAPGAEAAGNCAALLELIRRFKANRPDYNILFLADGAHHIALAGMREFVAANFVDLAGTATDDKKKDMARYRAFLGVDLTSRTPTVGFFGKAAFYNQMTVSSESLLLNQFSGLAKTLGRYAIGEAQKRGIKSEEFFVDGITGKEGRTWRSYMPSLIALDSEVSTMAAVPGLSFATANDARLLQDTPYDSPEKINFNNLAAQVQTVDDLGHQALTAIAEGDTSKDKSPVLPPPGASGLSKNFGTVVGRAIYRDVTKLTSFLPDTPLPDDQLPRNYWESVTRDPTTGQVNGKRVNVRDGDVAVGAVVTARGGAPLEYKSYSGVRGVIIERAQFSKEGKGQPPVSQFIFTGPRVGDTKGGGTPQQEFEAFSVNRSGFVTFAPDLGAERQRFSPLFTKTYNLAWKNEDLEQRNADVSLICFGCRASTIFDTLDQRYFSVLKEMTILDARTDANPVEYGYLKPAAPSNVAEIEPAGIVYSKPDERYKLIMAAGLLGKRLVLLRTDTPEQKTPIKYEGAGFTVKNEDQPNRVTRIAYQTALDLWTLDQFRIRLLKGFGINNERVDLLHGQAGCPIGEKNLPQCPTDNITAPPGGSLRAAQEAYDQQKYDVFYQQARRAFGLESRAYPDVEATSQDVLKGIIFYLALLLPFSYFVERMLFGFPDVRKQIAGTSVVFLGVFGAIRFVHPAFELALTPFIILALTVVVTAFLQSKFEQEIKRLKQGVHYADMGRLSAVGAALGLGIANMRRRPTRTALTCVTLVLLTFTVLSFTSVTANIANFARPYGDQEHTPAYQGFLIRQPDWSAMAEAAVASLANDIEAQGFGRPALRAWYLSRDQSEPLQLRVANSANPNKFYYAPALVGLTPEEVAIHSPLPGTLIKGRWFKDGETDVCLLPRDVLLSDEERKAASADPNATPTPVPSPTPTPSPDAVPTEVRDTGPPLGLTEANAIGAKIQIGGKELEVIGIYDDTKWYGRQGKDNLVDLDNEEFTPVDYSSDVTKANNTNNGNAQQQGDEVQVQRYEHMPANALLVLPYQTTINMGGTTRSVAVGISDADAAQAKLNDLMQRAALGIFGATPEKDPDTGKLTGKLTAKLYSSVEATSYEGFASLAVPILIAALIIANTMLGSVFERTREIGIYSSIGLAPVHVAALFIAEAAVYAVLGSISGYLIAQLVAKIITATNLLPGITLNYSSSSAVLSTLIVMATVLLSTLYPAWAASKLSQPDERKAELGEPIGDLWRLQFPFTVSGVQSIGMAQFLADYFHSHTDTSVGKFYTDKVFFTALPLREAVAVLNEGVPTLAEVAAKAKANGSTNGSAKMPKLPFQKAKAADVKETAPAPKGGPIDLESIAASPDLMVYRLSMRTWLAPFDMGVSQDTDIILLPAQEPGLYELQLRLERRSGEIAAWKRVNREFMTDLRKQLLLWRVIKPEGQQEYILRGRAHISGQSMPQEEPGAVVG
jgi:cell division protein FtsX